MPTRRVLIIRELLARVRTISVANGFETDVGAQVVIGEHDELGPDDDPQAIAVVIGDEDSKWQVAGKAFGVSLPVTFRALAKADLDEPWLTVEALIGDIKRAVETGDPGLGGLLTFPMERGPVRNLPRDPGSTTVAAAVSYRFLFKEGFGAP